MRGTGSVADGSAQAKTPQPQLQVPIRLESSRAMRPGWWIRFGLHIHQWLPLILFYIWLPVTTGILLPDFFCVHLAGHPP